PLGPAREHRDRAWPRGGVGAKLLDERVHPGEVAIDEDGARVEGRAQEAQRGKAVRAEDVDPLPPDHRRGENGPQIGLGADEDPQHIGLGLPRIVSRRPAARSPRGPRSRAGVWVLQNVPARAGAGSSAETRTLVRGDETWRRWA